MPRGKNTRSSTARGHHLAVGGVEGGSGPFLPSLMVMACTKPVAAPLGIPCPPPTPTGPQLSFPSQNSGIRPTSDSGTQTGGGEPCMETYVKAKATRAPLTTMKSRMFQRSRK